MDWLADLALILIVLGIVFISTIAILIGVFWSDEWSNRWH